MDYSDFVEAGAALSASIDDNQWKLGDLAAVFTATFTDDENEPTLGDFAGAIGLVRSTLSEYRMNAIFYPPSLRRFDELSFAHYTEARRRSADLEDAMDNLQRAQREAFSVAAFKRWLAGIYADVDVKVSELPAGVQGLIPSNVRRVHIRVSEVKESDND